eukprot:SAG31_NODE_4089_length_3600_cov_8.534704_3_plen_92_part_00
MATGELERFIGQQCVLTNANTDIVATEDYRDLLVRGEATKAALKVQAHFRGDRVREKLRVRLLLSLRLNSASMPPRCCFAMCAPFYRAALN